MVARPAVLLLAAAGLGALAPGACANILALSHDNSLAPFRNDPAQFYEDWPRPAKKMNGEALAATGSDIVVHSDDPSEGRLWVDYLYPFSAEVQFQGMPVALFTRRHWWVGYVTVSLYLIGIWLGVEFMKDREPFSFKAPLALWNLFLAVFSFIGTVRVGLQLALLLNEYGFDYTICRTPSGSYGSGAAGLWTAFFIYSKYAELLDTVFLVMRKRRVEFLHWYHHCSVLLYCWHSYVWQMPTGIYFIVMNYAVHTLMYSYYFLAAVRKRPPRWALMVTILQLAQMAGGIAITITHLKALLTDSVPSCDGHLPNLVAALMMYASYFILFAQFLFRRYCMRREGAEAKGLKKFPNMKLE